MATQNLLKLLLLLKLMMRNVSTTVWNGIFSCFFSLLTLRDGHGEEDYCNSKTSSGSVKSNSLICERLRHSTHYGWTKQCRDPTCDLQFLHCFLQLLTSSHFDQGRLSGRNPEAAEGPKAEAEHDQEDAVVYGERAQEWEEGSGAGRPPGELERTLDLRFQKHSSQASAQGASNSNSYNQKIALNFSIPRALRETGQAGVRQIDSHYCPRVCFAVKEKGSLITVGTI